MEISDNTQIVIYSILGVLLLSSIIYFTYKLNCKK
jgi:hypothetical protein